MTPYALLLAVHVIGVIGWLGTTTTMALLAAYGGRNGDSELLDRLPALARWLGPRVVAPTSLGTLLSGILLVVVGQLGFEPLWLKLAVDMVLKPTARDVWWLAGGATILALMLLRLVVTARRTLSVDSLAHT